jgi:hypothetical protein
VCTCETSVLRSILRVKSSLWVGTTRERRRKEEHRKEVLDPRREEEEFFHQHLLIESFKELATWILPLAKIEQTELSTVLERKLVLLQVYKTDN